MTDTDKTTIVKNTAKLEKAKSKLSPLSALALISFTELTAGKVEADGSGEPPLSLADLENLAAHLQFHVREQRTLAANETTLTAGLVVKVVSGPAELVGKIGKVNKVNRIRCFVEVDGANHYLFTSDLERVEEADAQTIRDEAVAPATETLEQAV